MTDPLILIVGAADTGRAPMAAAMLGRLLAKHGLSWIVASAGVVGHDEAPAEPEARSAMVTLGFDIDGHKARSLTDEHISEATLLLAVDSGVARVLRARYPDAATTTLGELAGRSRDIPDPFRMQVGAWVQYAGEIEAMLLAGLARLHQLVVGSALTPEPFVAPEATADNQLTPSTDAEPPLAVTLTGAAQPERMAAVERAGRLLGLFAELPGVVDWAGARRQLEADLSRMEPPLTADDLVRPYIALVRSMLGLTSGAPSASQAAALRDAVARLRSSIGPADLEALSVVLARFASSDAS